MINELNEIKSLFDEFYLIDEPLQQVGEVKEIPTKINFEGGNKKGLIFVFTQALSPADTDMIHKLLHNAMKLTMEDVSFINLTAQTNITFQGIVNELKPKKIIVWGTHSIMPAIALYEVTTLDDMKLIIVNPVADFHDNVTLKTTLWNSLQALLNG
jgi:hypothetical protein